MKKIYYNQKAAEAAISHRQEFYDKINEFGAALQKEAITLTPEIVGEFLSKGPPYIASLLVQEAAKQYERAGIKVTSVILGGLDQASRATAAKFEKHVLPLRHAQHAAHISWAELTINENGEAVFTDTERKEIEKQFTVFLKKESEPLWEQLNQLADLLNQKQQDLKKDGIDLFKSLKVIMSENSYVGDENFTRHPREDICLLLNKESKVEANPVIFS